MKPLRDPLGRPIQRPYFETAELDAKCEGFVRDSVVVPSRSPIYKISGLGGITSKFPEVRLSKRIIREPIDKFALRDVKLANGEKFVNAVRSGTQNVKVLIAQTPQVFWDRLNGNKEAAPRPKQFFVPFGLKDILRGKTLRFDLRYDERAQEDAALNHTDDVGTMLAKKSEYDLIALGNRSLHLFAQSAGRCDLKLDAFPHSRERAPQAGHNRVVQFRFDHLWSELSDRRATDNDQ
jgi:hypothetical protein